MPMIQPIEFAHRGTSVRLVIAERFFLLGRIDGLESLGRRLVLRITLLKELFPFFKAREGIVGVGHKTKAAFVFNAIVSTFSSGILQVWKWRLDFHFWPFKNDCM